MPSKTRIEYACGHKESFNEPGPEILTRSLTRVLTLGMAGISTAERTRTVQPSRSKRFKAGLKRVLSLGLADSPILRSLEDCPACQNSREVNTSFNTGRNEQFESDRYNGWIEPQPEVVDEQVEEPSLLQRRQMRRILAQEIQSQRALAPLEHDSGQRREQARGPVRHLRERTLEHQEQAGNDRSTSATQSHGPSSDPNPEEFRAIFTQTTPQGPSSDPSPEEFGEVLKRSTEREFF